MMKDPVSGMDVDEKTSKWMSEYKGKKYYFHTADDKTKFDQDPSRYAKQTDAQVKVMAKDPVSGKDVDENTAKWTSKHEGKKYYFHTADDKTKFDQDPSRYAK